MLNEQRGRANQHTLHAAIQRAPPEADSDESPKCYPVRYLIGEEVLGEILRHPFPHGRSDNASEL